MKTGYDNGKWIMRKFGDLSLTRQKDERGVRVIGYGHVMEEGDNTFAISEDEAAILLNKDFTKALVSLKRWLGSKFRALNDNEVGSVISLAYSIGLDTFKVSKAFRELKGLNRRGYVAEALTFRFVELGSEQVPLSNLMKRRVAEKLLFECPQNKPFGIPSDSLLEALITENYRP